MKAKISVIQNIADYMHDSFCRYSHADGCSYYYESWDKMFKNGARERYLFKAEKLYDLLDKNQDVCKKVIDVISK